MSIYNCYLVFEVDYEKLKEANKELEEAKKKLIEVQKLSKGASAEFSKQVGKVDDELKYLDYPIKTIFDRINNLLGSDIYKILDISTDLTLFAYNITAASSLIAAGFTEIGLAVAMASIEWEKSSFDEMCEIAQKAIRDYETIRALQWAMQKGIPGANELYDLLLKISKEPKLPELENFLGVSYWKDATDQMKGMGQAIDELMKTDYGQFLQTITLAYKDQEAIANTLALATKDFGNQLRIVKPEEYTSKLNDATKSTAELASNVDELKKKCDSALRSLRQFLAESKLGDLAAYDTSKQSSIWGDLPPPPTDIGDYDFGYTLKELEEQAQQFRKIDLAGWKGWADGILGLFGNMWSSIKGTYKQFETGFQDISKSWSTGAEKGGFFGGLQASLPGIGSMIGMITQIPEIVKQVWDSIKEFARGIASLFGEIGDFLININTHLFLFIKYNYSLQQHSYAKEIRVGTGYLPVRYSDC